jgi:hypothetical protein
MKQSSLDTTLRKKQPTNTFSNKENIYVGSGAEFQTTQRMKSFNS